MSEIQYVIGDVTEPIGDGPKIIAHICNNIGGWGRGFVLALSAKWPEPEESYRQWYRDYVDGWDGAGFELGNTRFVRCTPNPDGIVVANMIAQRGYTSPSVPRAMSYTALTKCLSYVGNCAKADGDTIHMPRIGTGLGGGDWTRIEAIINETICGPLDVPVTVYDLPS